MSLTAPALQAVDEIVARAQRRGRAPSIAAAVLHGGDLVHLTGAGETPLPHRDLQYRIGSLTKSLTAAALLGLRPAGVNLEDPVSAYLPVPQLGELRLRQLLGHVSGVQREPDGEWWERSPGQPLAHLLAGLTPEKVAFGPYARFHYSNLAYGLLGGVIEQVTGEAWWQVVAERVLRPLGMHRTTYHPQEPFARGYVVHPWRGTLREEPRHDAGAMAPAGQLWSTVDDMVRWGVELATPTVLPAADIEEMARPVALADPLWTAGYGLGLHLWRRGERVFVGHTGSMPGYLAVLAVHRPTGTGVVAFVNAYSLAGLRIGAFGVSLLEAALTGVSEPIEAPWRPSGPVPPGVEPLCGRWWWMGIEVHAQWDASVGELVLWRRLDPAEETRFVPTADPDRWVGRAGEDAGEHLRVLRGPGGDVTGLDIATFVYTRDPDQVHPYSG